MPRQAKPPSPAPATLRAHQPNTADCPTPSRSPPAPAPEPGEKLARYRAKRDFARSPEPAGEAPNKASAGPDRHFFCVQRHDATRLHYDLRLEWGGVLKSWAVTRGPSLDPADKRLAVEVEDHPVDYGTFEGVIPKPGYGAGTVQLWDRGVWAPLAPERVDADLAKGELKFVVAGERLQGGYVLVRLKPRAGETKGRNNWLLIKERDSAAQPGGGDAVLQAATSVKTGRTLAEIAAGLPAPDTAVSDTAPAASGSATPGDAATGKPAAKAPPHKAPKAAKATAAARPTVASARPTAMPTPTVSAAIGKAPFPGAPPPASAGRQRLPPRRAAGPPPAGFIAPQLCTLVATPPRDAAWVHELKLDGYRLQVAVTNGTAVLRTRTGLDWSDRFPAIAEAARALPDCVLDGEAVALDADNQPDFGALQATLAGEAQAPIVFYAFDLLRRGADDLRALPLLRRKAALRDLLPDAGATLRYLAHFTSPGDAVLASACRLSLEGIVSKRGDAAYASGRAGHWTKAKCRGRDEFLIGGWSVDRAGHGLGALLVGARRDGRLVYLGRVGTGYSAATATRLVATLRERRRTTTPFAGRQPARTNDVTWCEPDAVAEVAYGGWTEEGLLRHASFLGLREDKPTTEIEPPADAPVVGTAEPRARHPATAASGAERGAVPPAGPSRPKAAGKPGKASTRADATSQAVAAARSTPETPQRTADPGTPPRDPATRPPPRPRPAAGLPPLTHPDRVLWPATDDTPAVTKADLAAYCARYADLILAQIGGRPLSLLRAPDGLGAPLFFQRHAMRGQSPLIGSVPVPGQDKPYLRVDDPPGLAALAQMAAVEFHPWGAMADAVAVPDRLVFDLDPAEGLDFAAVIAAAHVLRERLAHTGLTAFAKVTGGKGLHLVVPLATAGRAACGWPEAKQFARLVCALLERDAPDRFTTTLAKQARTGRIFLDYLRNDRLATAVAAWSPRGRPGAPVARPIAWSAVKAGLRADAWRLHDMLDAPAARDPWTGFADAAASLRDAIGRLTRDAGPAAAVA